MRSCVLLLSLIPSATLAATSATPAPAALPAFDQGGPVRSETTLLLNGRAPIILAPAHDAGQAAAVMLKAALAARLGVEPVVATKLADCVPGRQTCIALGNMLDNELLTRLYFSHYTFEDALFPGPDGFTVHAVFDPWHWPGANVIVLGVSRPQALPGACERFLSRLRGTGSATELPYTLDIEPAKALSAAERRGLEAKPVDPSFTDFRLNAEQYLKSGEDAYAQRALAALDIMVDVYAKTPGRKTPWPEETTAGDIFAAWDAFEESPMITPEKRVAYLGSLFLWSRDLTRCSYQYRAIDETFTVTWNHTTFALLGLYHAGRYFDRHFKVPEAAEWLRRARLGFRAQARSWKPMEDADSYLVLTMRHVIEFCLADWDLQFFESGRIRQYADYVVACGDTRQLPAGFGDSGYSVAPTMAAAALPIAFWWTRDGGYRWILEKVSPKGWQSPYWQEVEEVEPTRFTGLNVLPLDRQIYDDTQKRPSYNEPVAAAAVPFEQAWDKISFRQNWDPNGQYLLLDGLGRGKHLHFDTNSITTFVQDGERWLLDHDYLTRNTTEHTMLSVLRDGRCSDLVPSLAGLAAAGEVPGLAATRSYVEDYNGVDWQRQVLWCPGRWFLVRDAVTAREAGHYDLDLTWKTIDRNGQTVDTDGRFTARRAGALESVALAPVEDAAAGNGKAVVFSEASSRLVFGVDLAAGEYEVDAIAYGLDGSSDSLFLSVDGGAQIDIHVPQQHYGSSRSAFDGSSGTARLRLAADGPHVVRVTLRENPPVRLDRLEFRPRGGGEPTVIQAEAAPPVATPARARLPESGLHIDSAVPVSAWITNHVRQGLSVPVSILHQRQSAELKPGEATTFCSLLYATGPSSTRGLTVQAVGPTSYSVSSTTGTATAGFGRGQAGAWACDAEAWLVDQDGVRGVGVCSLGQGAATLSFEPPAGVSLSVSDGRLTVVATVPTRVTITGWTVETQPPPADPRALSLGAGTHVVGLKGLVATGPGTGQPPGAATPPAARPAPGAALPVLQPLWTVALVGDRPVFRITPADLDGDGKAELLVACGQAGYAVSGAGKLLWSYGTGGTVRDVSLARFAGDAAPTVLVSSADTYLHQVEPGGTLKRKDQMTGIYFSADHGERPWGLYCTRAVDSDTDGGDDMLVTTLASMESWGLSADLSKRWRTLAAYHGCMDMAVADVNRDGKPEVVIGNKYGSVYVLRLDGSVLLTSYTSIGDVAFALGDLNGDGNPEIVHGSSTGDLVAVDLKGTVLWRFDNYGYPVEAIRCADVNGDGRPELLIASGTGYLYCVAADGTRLWEQRLGVAVHDAAVVGGVIVAGTEDGALHAIDGAGQTLWAGSTGAAVMELAVLPDADQTTVVAGLADGRLLGVAVKR